MRKYKNINWWLDKGLGGFALMQFIIINIKKALPMHDYEPDREDGLCRALIKCWRKGLGGFRIDAAFPSKKHFLADQ